MLAIPRLELYSSVVEYSREIEALPLYKHFVVKPDHHSLKYLLKQKVTTAVQQKGLTKLLGFGL